MKMMNPPMIGYDELLIIIYRQNLNLLHSARMGFDPLFNRQLHLEMINPKPLDFVMRTDYEEESPVTTKIGRLIAYTPAKEGNSCLHTVTLLDGTITTWRNKRVIKIPTAIFCMKTKV